MVYASPIQTKRLPTPSVSGQSGRVSSRDQGLQYDGDNVVGDLQNGSMARFYVTPFLDQNLSMTVVGGPQAGIYYYSQDGLGSVRTLTNSSGNIANHYDYDAFGVPLPVTTSETVAQRYTYTGREASGVGGASMYYRYRGYMAGIGRMNNRNPWGYGIHREFAHLYDYVSNRPNFYKEPFSGEACEDYFELSKSFVLGLGQGGINIGRGLYKFYNETVNVIADDINFVSMNFTYGFGEVSEDYEYMSQTWRAYDSGVISRKWHVGRTLLNFASAGIWGEGEAVYAWANGAITTDELSETLGSIGVLQIGAYATVRGLRGLRTLRTPKGPIQGGRGLSTSQATIGETIGNRIASDSYVHVSPSKFCTLRPYQFLFRYGDIKGLTWSRLAKSMGPFSRSARAINNNPNNCCVYEITVNKAIKSGNVFPEPYNPLNPNLPEFLTGPDPMPVSPISVTATTPGGK